MGKILMSDDMPEVKKWCVYALSQPGGRGARMILEEFAETKPNGVVVEELRCALEHQ